jgi:hypothetical protein
MGKHPVYNKYDNPYASPVELKDNAVCASCGDSTGFTGESLHGERCGFCYSFYSEEVLDD